MFCSPSETVVLWIEQMSGTLLALWNAYLATRLLNIALQQPNVSGTWRQEDY